MKIYYNLLATILVLLGFSAQAGSLVGAQQNHAELMAAVTSFVKDQTGSLPGHVDIKVEEIDRRISLTACPTLEVFMPPGSVLLGSSVVGVRCPGKRGWSLFVPVHVTDTVSVVTTSKPLAQDHVLVAEDLSSQNAELSQTGIVTDPMQAIGKVLKSGISAGQVLKLDMLRAPYSITRGQKVQLQVLGAGFSIRSEGVAVNNASEGQAVQVKIESGKIISGTAQSAGIVQIRP